MAGSFRAILIAGLTAGLASTGAVAFECPQHFAAAEEQIDKVMEDMEGMEAMMSKENMMLVHTLLDDAKMLLEGARHNHERPQGPFDHARAIAKADAALGYATAADILHFKQMQTTKEGGGMQGGQMKGMQQQ